MKPRRTGQPSPPPAPDDPARFDEALEAFRKRVPMTSDEWDALDETMREYAFTAAGATEATIVARVYEAIEKAIEDGEDIDQFRERVGDVLEDPGQLETVFRTNVNSAYNAGRHAIFSAPKTKEARPYFRFEVIDDDRLDEDCEQFEGVVLPQDDPFWDSHVPPLHFNCRCSFTAVSQEEADEDGGVDDEAPSGEADDGFGGRPSDYGADWEGPDLTEYPAAVGDVLRDVLDR